MDMSHWPIEAKVEALALLERKAQLVAEREREAERRRLAENIELVRARCMSLGGFVRESWKQLEPEATYVHGWHIDAICEHLEAVSAGQINRLLINVPPGSMKSLLTSVNWQAWEWGPRDARTLRYLTTAFNDVPVKRDTRKTRDLVDSEWYRMHWPEVHLTRKAELSFANSDTGTREGVAFGSLTGQRGDRLVIDDPHSTETAESDADREATTRRFREGAQNRLNDQRKSAIVVIMQRLHMDDVSGVIEQYQMDYDHLLIPMEFEPARAKTTSIGWRDPRKADGELMCPERWDRETLTRMREKEMGEYAYAGQYQQRPAPREGGMMMVDRIEIVAAAPAGGREVRGWDIAGSTKKKSPYTAGARLKRMPNGDVYVIDMKRDRRKIGAAEDMIVETAKADGLYVRQSLPQDPGSAGLSQKNQLAGRLEGLDFRFSPETGTKEDRAIPVASMIEVGKWYLVRADWNAAYIDELRNFPTGSFKDQVDATSRAYAELIGTKEKSKGLAKPRVRTPT